MALCAYATAFTVSSPPPPPTAALYMASCVQQAANQTFYYNVTDHSLRTSPSIFNGGCLTFGGGDNRNVYIGDCEDWVVPLLGAQAWEIDSDDATLRVWGSFNKTLNVWDCNDTAPSPVRVCVAGSAEDCRPTGKPDCGDASSMWSYFAGPGGGLLNNFANDFGFCVEVGGLAQ